MGQSDYLWSDFNRAVRARSQRQARRCRAGIQRPARLSKRSALLRGHRRALRQSHCEGHFTLDGKEYSLALNTGQTRCTAEKIGLIARSGRRKFFRHDCGCRSISYVSKDGEENFPGILSVSVTYTLTDTNELKLVYRAETDQDTPSTSRTIATSPWAARGRNILDEILFLKADEYTPVDATLIPTGEIKSVKGTPLDFTKPTAIGARINEIKEIGGYDHNFVIMVKRESCGWPRAQRTPRRDGEWKSGQPNGGAVLFRHRPKRKHCGEGRHCVSEVWRALPGDAALS